MDLKKCSKCIKSIDVNGCLICEICNISCNKIKNCPLKQYQFSNQYDFISNE